MEKQNLVAMQDADLEGQHEEEQHRIVKVPSSLCYSVFTTLCCCTPIGIVAMLMSLLSQESASSGKYEKATRRAQLSRKMSHLAVLCGFLLYVLVVAEVIVIFVVYMPMFQRSVAANLGEIPSGESGIMQSGQGNYN